MFLVISLGLAPTIVARTRTHENHLFILAPVSSRPEKPCTREKRNYLSQKQVKDKRNLAQIQIYLAKSEARQDWVREEIYPSLLLAYSITDLRV